MTISVRTNAKLPRIALILTLGTLLAMATSASANAANCSPSEIRSGACVSGNLNNGAAVLEGSAGTPGNGNGGGGNGGGNDDGNGAPVDPFAQCLIVVNVRCLYAVDHGIPVQPITLADIAAFRPDSGVDHMEPNGWMIVGLDTNFFATGGMQVKNGTLLGQAAAVRFTPRTWHWTYGDGSGAAVGTPGGSWAAQGIPEFDPTATSHIYRAAGTYYIQLTIDYSAEYQFAGTAWIGIAGILPVPANELVATAGSAKTVLVERACTVNPAGPGC